MCKFEDLKPCPFCGGKASLYVTDGVCVICLKCNAMTEKLRDFRTGRGMSGNATARVVELWNKRHGAQENTEDAVNKDLINRQAVLEVLYRNAFHEGRQWVFRDKIMQQIRELPPGGAAPTEGMEDLQ